MRRAARVDTNHSAVVKAFRECGCTIEDLSGVGGGCPDIVIGLRGESVFVEIKDGKRKPSEQKLTPAQAIWHRDWKGSKAIVRSPEEARALVERIGA